VTLRRGFKADAERLSLEVRAEVGLGPFRRLDPLRLAEHLEIPVLAMSSLGLQDSTVAASVAVLQTSEQAAVSALTVMRGTARVVVYNDVHSPGRIANSITHEISHGVLLHPASPALDHRGCRLWDKAIEEEATFLAGALLVPAKAAWGIAKQRKPVTVAADEYGCSEELIRWRINVTGAGRLSAV
jgi:Zn-dependent peptidase ImmA (M78 family)